MVVQPFTDHGQRWCHTAGHMTRRSFLAATPTATAGPSAAPAGRPPGRRRTTTRPSDSRGQLQRVGAVEAAGGQRDPGDGDGHASRTNQHSAGLAGRGRCGGVGAVAGRSRRTSRSRRCRCRRRRPEDECRSGRAVRRGQQVAGRLVGGVPDVHLVEADQLLAVVEGGAAPWCGAATRPAGADRAAAPPTRRPVADQHPGVAAGLRVDADRRAARRGTSPRWRPGRPGRRRRRRPRAEQEPGQVVAVDRAAPPVGRDGGRRRRSAPPAGPRAGPLTSSRSRPPRRAGRLGRRPGAVPGEQLVQLAAAAAPPPPAGSACALTGSDRPRSARSAGRAGRPAGPG